MIELLVAMTIFSILASLGTTGWLRYQRAVEHRSSAQELASALRNAQQAALTEAVTYCVAFNATNRSYQVYKFACDGSGVAVGDMQTTQSARVLLANASFTQADGSAAAALSFLPRGSATPGSVAVTRSGSAKTYTISVEGLTGRVSLSG